MRPRLFLLLASLELSVVSRVVAQGVAAPPGVIYLSGYETHGSGVPAGSNSTLLAFTVEGDSTGNNTFDIVTSDPGVVVSLVLPSGSSVTSGNAVSLGFVFTVAPEGTPAPDVHSVQSLPGTHTIIQVPAGQTSGTYQVRADASSVATDSGIIATYYSSSNVRAGVIMNAYDYKVGDTVVLSAVVFDGLSPVAGAIATASISAPVSLATQTSIGNFQLIGQQQVTPNLIDYSYQASVTNTGSAIREVQAEVAALPSNVALLSDTLAFGNVPANSTAASVNNLIIETSPAQPFDPATLQWNVTTPGTPANVTLADSGPFDAATGDGIYTGTFTPPSAGTYGAVVRISGSSSAGVSFSRTVATEFRVSPAQLASFTSFSDTQQPGLVAVIASVNVQTAGTYRLTLQMQGGNLNITQSSATVTLPTGAQQISVPFPNTQLFDLGVDGPYERINALLVYTGAGGDLIVDSRSDAGPTAAYTLNSVAPPLRFTGQNSAAGIVTGSGPAFDLLRVTMGVSTASTGVCDWSAILTDLSGNQIAFSAASGSVPGGASSVTLDFDGTLIAQAGNGPYLVKNATIHCGTLQVNSATLFQTQSFTASQFKFVAPDFSMSVTSSPGIGAPGASFSFGVYATAIGPFNGTVTFGVSGVPSGATATFNIPGVPAFGPSTLTIATTTTTPPGVYTLTITGTSGTLTHSVTATLTIGANLTLDATPGGQNLLVSLDGGPSFAVPHTYTLLVPGSTHTIATTSPQPGAAGTQYVFLNWSDSGALSHTITTPSANTTYTASFKTQYQLTTQVSPNTSEGSISPAAAFFDAGSSVPVSATANTGYVFTGFTGALTGTTTPQNVTVSAPVTVTANFQPGPTSLGGSIGLKSGPMSARVWPIVIGNNGPGAALQAAVVSFTLQQTSGTACTPVLVSRLPVAAGDLAPQATGTANVVIDFSSCPSNAFFKLTAGLSATSGAATGTLTRLNQLP